MKKWNMLKVFFSSMVFIGLLTLVACEDECMVECKLDGTMQIDSAFAIDADTVWILGEDSIQLVYINDSAEEMIFDVAEYRHYHTMSTFPVPCGECGDTVNTTLVIPHFDYQLSGDQSLDISIEMHSNYFVDEEERLLKCIRGEMTFIEGGNRNSVTFLADCNSTFDKEEEVALNRTWLDLNWTIADTTISSCPIDSGQYFHTTSGQVVDAVFFDHKLPIKKFKYDDECWSFDRTIPK
jgi:hypothetical protein